jgi:FAD/FMN-containing dehydrogenase/Fe-S oxidoreductase
MNTQHEENDSLKLALSEKIRGEVRFEKGDLSLYSTDASNYRYLPIGVVIPRDREDIIATVAVCRSMNVPIVSRGGGTGLAGQTTNHAVVMDMTKYFHHVIEINPEGRWARVQPGIVLDDINRAVEKHNLIVGPDPATHSHCTIGGMIGNNSCGVHAQWAGKMESNVLELEVLTYDGEILRVGETSQEELAEKIRAGGRTGEIYRDILKLRDQYAQVIRDHFPHIPRRVSGYNLNELLPENKLNLARALVGSESTLVTVLEAKIKLLEKPKVRGLIVLGFPEIEEAADQIEFLDKLGPMGLEGVDELLRRNIEIKHINEAGLAELPKGNAWLLLEFGADDEKELEALIQKKTKKIQQHLSLPDDHVHVILNPEDQEKVWKVREAGLGATARNVDNNPSWPGWEDAAVPPEKIGSYLRDFKKLLAHYGYKASLYGHFGQGCIHCSIDFDLETHEGVENFHAFIREAARLVSKYGGSLSGEHGDGQARGELLGLMYGSEVIHAFEEFKRIWDPLNRMNPGKIVHPNGATDHLRFGEHHANWELPTHFSYVDDKGSFAFAVQRCAGVGNCRQLEGQTMCPSYKVTLEEKHSTRGRSRLLFEMMKKDTLLKPWKEEAVKESLDLCLACKGCKSDCPVTVDMATYKAEFLSHYFKGRLRPMAAYTMGLIFFWNRIAAFVPTLVNFLTHQEPFAWIVKKIGGIAPARDIPRYAKKTFRKGFRKRSSHGKEVILWTDSFNNYFHPQVLSSLEESLERLGYHVSIPEKNLCCGRPLYDYGMLDLAKKMLKRVLTEMKPQIEAGTPVIFAEPSCLAVFRDELMNLFPNDKDALRLSKQSFTIAEFLQHEKLEFDLSGDATAPLMFHGHCHHKSLDGEDSDRWLLSKLGDTEILKTGCCGMAGSFGFEAGEKYDVSVAVGENDLLPKLRERKEKILIADGFSCREQVYQSLGKYPLHTAELLLKKLQGEKHD